MSGASRDTKERVIETISEVLRLDAAGRAILESDSDDETIEGWDSASHVEIIVALEDEFGIEIEVEAIARLGNVRKIVAYLDSRAEEMRAAGTG